MSLTPDQLSRATGPVVSMYRELETALLEKIAEKIVEGSMDMEENSLEWQLSKLAQMNALTKESQKLIAKMTGKSQKEIARILRESGYDHLQEMEGQMEMALEAGVLLFRPPSLNEDNRVFDILQTYTRQAHDELNLVNTTMLIQSQQIYRDILNQTTAEVLAGVSTRQQALRKVLTKWNEKGIPVLRRSDGTQVSAEGHVNTIMRSVTNDVTNEMTMERMRSYGNDLIETSAHDGARPKCAPYQGRIFSLSGNHPKYPAFSTTSYGEKDGLFGINCGHQQYPFFEGLSERTFRPVPAEKNKKIYDQSQKQRQYERDIRKAKSRQRVLQAAGDEEGAAKAGQLVRQRQARMRSFIDDSGRTRRYGREQII